MRHRRVVLIAAAVPVIAAGVAGLNRQPENPPPIRNPVSPYSEKSRPGDFVLPPGIYTSIIFANPTGSTATVTLKIASGEATIVVPEKDTVVVPFGQGWQLGQQGTGTTTQSGVVVTGITTSGPIRFSAEKK